MWAFPMQDNAYGAAGALVRMPGFRSGGNSVLVYFHCADCAVEAARVVPAGGQIQRDKFPIGHYGFIALAVDTEHDRAAFDGLTPGRRKPTAPTWHFRTLPECIASLFHPPPPVAPSSHTRPQ
jgi:hypothetical protein